MSDQIPFPGIKIVEDPNVPPGEVHLRPSMIRDRCISCGKSTPGTLNMFCLECGTAAEAARIKRIRDEGLCIGNVTPCPTCNERVIGRVGDTQCPVCAAAAAAHDAPTEAIRSPLADPFPDDQVDENRVPTQATTKVIRCAKCKTPIETALAADQPQVCSLCFSLMLNSAGVPVPDPAAKPIRVTNSQRCSAADVVRHERVLPEAIEQAIGAAAEALGAQLRDAFMAGDPTAYHLLAQAKEHGMLVMVVVQAAMKAPAPVQPVSRRAGKPA